MPLSISSKGVKWINYIINRIMNQNVFPRKKKRLRFNQRKRYQIFERKKQAIRIKHFFTTIESTHRTTSNSTIITIYVIISMEERVWWATKLYAHTHTPMTALGTVENWWIVCSLDEHAENLLSMENKLEFDGNLAIHHLNRAFYGRISLNPFTKNKSK